MYHVILEAILCLDYSQAHNTGTKYRSDTCISRPAAVLLSIKIHTALKRRAGE